MVTDLGKDIEAWRTSLGLSRARLGRILNVDQMTIRSWEREGVVPNPGNMDRLEAAGFQRRDVAA